MRKFAVFAALAAFSVTGVAYAAVTVTNQYVISTAKVSPAKSGTKKHPVPVSGQISWTTTTSPTGYRPNIVSKYKFTFQGLVENTNQFPVCSTSRVLSATEGPNTCPKGSLAGRGYFIAAAGPAANQKSVLLTCRVETTLYNAGNHSLTLYVYEGKQVAGQPAPCPLPSPGHYAIDVSLGHSSKGLTESFTVPNALRHPDGLDAGQPQALINVLLDKKQVGKGRKRHTVGLFASVSCPKNHRRQISATFTTESGTSRTATRSVACR